MRQRRKRRQTDRRGPLSYLPIRRYLLLLALVSLTLTSVTSARYARTFTHGDTARVAQFGTAQFGVTVLEETLEFTLLPDETLTAEISLKNDSEVAVRCTPVASKNETGSPITFSPAGVTLQPGEQQLFTVTIQSPVEVGVFKDVVVKFTVVQVD